MNILNKVNSSNDIKRLNKNELPQLCAELREFIIENVSKTGGHLASNLGTVELTIALQFMTARWTESCSMSAIRAMLTK